MFDRENLVWVILGVVVVWRVVDWYVRRRVNLQKVDNGEDMAKLKAAVAGALPGEAGYDVLYAHHEETTYVGRRTYTHYYYYALAFDDARLWVIPIEFEKEAIRTREPNLFTKEELGDVTVNVIKKGEEIKSIGFVLRDKEGKNPASIDVAAVNYKADTNSYVNISQKSECVKFSAFLTALSDQVKGENRELQQKMEKDAEKGIRIVGILGILFCLVPLIGLIMGGIGLLLANKPSETGGRPKAGFVLSLIALILGVLVPVGEVLLIYFS